MAKAMGQAIGSATCYTAVSKRLRGGTHETRGLPTIHGRWWRTLKNFNLWLSPLSLDQARLRPCRLCHRLYTQLYAACSPLCKVND